MPAISGEASIRPIHLNPQAELAERVLLPGDPRRALAIAQALLDTPKMFNTRRGLWGYTGVAADGLPATIQSTGMGGPSAAIVIEELVALGARLFVRVGTCGAFDPELAHGDLVAAGSAIAGDGTSRALGAGDRVGADPRLTRALCEAGAREVVAYSTDLFYDPQDGGARPHPDAQVVEMETATLFTVAARHGLPAACLLGVTDVLADGRRRLADDEVEALGVRLGETALAALAG